MAQFLNDQFTGSGSMSTRSADTTGGAWAGIDSVFGIADPSVTGGSCPIGGGGGIFFFDNAASPAGTDYTTLMEFTPTSNDWVAVAVARSQADDSAYFLLIHNAGYIHIYKKAAGTGWVGSELNSTGSHSIAASDRTSHTLEFTVTTSGSVNTFSGELDGSPISFGTITADNTILTAGEAGFGGRGITCSYITGDDAGATAFTLPSDQGSFALTGQTAGLLFNRTLTTDYGAYALTGQDATLQKDTPGAFTMPADAGSYAWNGQAALADYAMNGGQGSYALTGQDVTFSRGFPQNYSLTAEGGSYVFSGKTARLDWSGAPIVPNRQIGIYMGMRIGL